MRAGRNPILVFVILLLTAPVAKASISSQGLRAAAAPPAADRTDAHAGAELRAGIALTSQGRFHEAIPHLLAAHAQVPNEFAGNFDLALCYVATRQFEPAIRALTRLVGNGHRTTKVYSLLAQAYIGAGQSEPGWQAFEVAAGFAPQDEKLYLFVADACTDHHDYALGLKVASAGLQRLPQSARLHYERAVFLSFLNRPNLARDEFERTARLAPGTAVAYMAGAQKALIDGDVADAIQTARRGVRGTPNSSVLLTLLAEALIRSGAAPGQPAFTEAETALDRSVNEQPDNAEAQLALGQLFLMANRLDDAITHLQIARELWSRNPSVYAHLARAYQERGEDHKAQEMLAMLAALNREQAAQYRSGPPGHRAGYTGAGTEQGQAAH